MNVRTLILLVLAAALEVGGDALIRGGLQRRGALLLLSGAATLVVYGFMVNMTKLDFSRLRVAQRDGALVEARAAILLDRISQEENIVIDDEELDRELQIAALQSREPVEALKARLTEDGGLTRIREQLRREKTASLLYERLPV